MVVAVPVSLGTTWLLDTCGLRLTVRTSGASLFPSPPRSLLTAPRLLFRAAGAGGVAERARSAAALRRRAEPARFGAAVPGGDAGSDARRPRSAARHLRAHQAGGAVVPRPSAGDGEHARLHVWVEVWASSPLRRKTGSEKKMILIFKFFFFLFLPANPVGILLANLISPAIVSTSNQIPVLVSSGHQNKIKCRTCDVYSSNTRRQRKHLYI